MLLEEERHRTQRKLEQRPQGWSLQAKVSRQPLGGGREQSPPSLQNTEDELLFKPPSLCWSVAVEAPGHEDGGPGAPRGHGVGRHLVLSWTESAAQPFPQAQRGEVTCPGSQHAWETPAPGPGQSPSYSFLPGCRGLGMEAWLRQLMAVDPRQDTLALMSSTQAGPTEPFPVAEWATDEVLAPSGSRCTAPG